MKSRIWLALAISTLAVSGAATGWAQEKPAESAPAAESKDDPVGKQAAELEAELGKLKDTSAEAGELLIKLVNLYYDGGRVFGLIRSGEKFVTHHPLHEKHRDVMYRLILGQLAVARNKDVVGNARQFLLRYPEAPECARVENILAQTLEQMNDRLRAGEAFELVWKRAPATEGGREAGVKAMTQYALAQTLDGYKAAAALGDQMLDAYEAGQFTSLVGNQAFQNWLRASDWVKANATANRLLKKSPPKEPEALRSLHAQMAENYGRLGQRANAVESYKQARALQDSEPVHRGIILEMYNGSAKGAEMEPLVNEYMQKYADREDRFTLRSYLAMAYLRDGDKPKALAMMAEVLPYDAVTHSLASVLVRENGAEPEQMAKSEQTLLAALGTNQKQAAYLRYVLSLELYRDKMKDLAKARQTAKELVFKSPSNDGHTQAPMHWLLATAETDAEFQADAAELIKVRKQKIHWASHRQYLGQWVTGYANDAKLAPRAAWLKTQLEQADADPFVKDWLDTENPNGAISNPARFKMLAPENLAKLDDEQARLIYGQLGFNVYHYYPTEERNKSVVVYGGMAKRFPKDALVAFSWLQSAYSYGTPEAAKEASLHMMAQEPIADTTASYYMALIADRNKDPDLLKQVYGWMQKVQQKHGLATLTYYDTIGDVLEKHEMNEEAMTLWKAAAKADYNNSYSRTCAGRILARQEPEARIQSLQKLVQINCDYHGAYAMLLADEYLKNKDLDAFEKVLQQAVAMQKDRAFRVWGFEDYPTQSWIQTYRTGKDFTDAEKRRVFTAIRNLRMGRSSAAAALALLELPEEAAVQPLDRLLAFEEATTMLYDDTTDWDWLFAYAQAAMARRDYTAVASLVSGMLSNIPNIDPGRQQAGRDMVAQSYARMGTVGLSIDENSPIAPLLQAALYLRLGDERLALDAYTKNKPLFDEHRNELPVDLILFVCDNHIAAGGEENYERVEEILRGWLVKFSEAMDIDNSTKANVQLMLAKNYFRAQRFDIARSEYTTVINRFPGTPEATEAEFGIGESFMAQKVYDQAEAKFEQLAGSKQREVIIRAEFLRGVLANRRGDRDEARDIFKGVLEMVPNVELANQALYNLAEVYGAEQRYMDQLELLRTVGRLGRSSKRWHTPGTALSIVVQDSDLGISRGHARIPVRVRTAPGGDEETIYLYSGGAGKGLFRADLETRLGEVAKGDRVLQMTGKDTIYCDYPEEFKADFKTVPLSDAEIKIAANGKLEIASTKIVDKDKETFSDRLAREQREEQERDRPISQNRPSNQIKPGNPIYLRVQDADQDFTNEPDKISVKLVASSGDQVRVDLQETGPHTGVFEGTANTGELPAGALASDTAIDHSPLMSIDTDPATFWLSEPDGATPKNLAVDMKDLRSVNHVTITSPDASRQTPVRGRLEGSHDGRFWYRLASVPPQPPALPVDGEYGEMTMRAYAGNYLGLTTWQQVVDLTKNTKPSEEGPVDQLLFSRPNDAIDAAQPYGIVWHGKFVQPRAGAVRFAIQAARSALAVDGELEMELGNGGNRTVDVWMDAGTHDLTIFAATGAANQPIVGTRAREDHNAEQIVLTQFRTSDFDLEQSSAKPAAIRAPATVKTDNGVWDFDLESIDLRHVRIVVQEYIGEAVAISHVQISGDDEDEPYIPTKSDVLGLSNNEQLEIAAGDTILANYTDEFTQTGSGRSQLLTGTLQATYFNAKISPIAYDFVRERNGAVLTIRKQLMRIDPGERFIVEITDYDADATAGRDTLTFQVSVNDGEPIELTALETEFSGIFTKEVDTSAMPASGKLAVQSGDRIYCSYVDAQNTFPGHSMAREAIVYVNQPSDGRARIIETRIVPPPKGSQPQPPQVIYLPPEKRGAAKKQAAQVAFEAPLTIEVYDRDAAKDSRSTVIVELETTDGAKIEAECVVSDAFTGIPANTPTDGITWALEEGRFVGQVILQLGSKNSADLVPLSANMPRNLVGRAKIGEEEVKRGNETLVTRVLNVSGKDIIKISYKDLQRADNSPKALISRGRLIANGELACVDRDYERPNTQLHVGERMFLMVTDADVDVSDERDFAVVEVTTERGEKEEVKLEETLAHSGVFTGSIALRPAESPTPSNLNPDDPAIETYFGDTVNLKYVDKAASTETGELEVNTQVPVVIGTDGLVAAFSKTFGNEDLAVETQFHIAESYFELFKSHKKLERSDDLKSDLEAGRRVLREVMEDYPDPKYVPRTAYLLGQFAQELTQWHEAIDAYKLIVRQYPEHSLAVDAQYKMAQCYEEAGDFDEALEAYVTLAATYPKSPLIANVMIRISERFYKDQNYEVAAQVGEKFAERFEGHEWTPRMAFRVGQCYYKGKQYVKAADAFDKFAKVFPDDPLCADSMFWSGESYRMANNNSLAFRRYNRCRWDFPATEAAKYARGRLALPAMLQQFEAEANVDE